MLMAIVRNHEPLGRAVVLHKREIRKRMHACSKQGDALVALRRYLKKRQELKVEVAWREGKSCMKTGN